MKRSEGGGTTCGSGRRSAGAAVVQGALACLLTAQRISGIAIMLGLLAMPQSGVAQETPARVEAGGATQAVDEVVRRIAKGALVLDGSGQITATRRQGDEPPTPLLEQHIVEALGSGPLSDEQAAALWDALAAEDNVALLTLPVVSAAVRASSTPKAREAMWSELGGLARDFSAKNRAEARHRSLLGFFERHRQVLRPLLTEIRETESSGDEMVDLMVSTRVLGESLDAGLAWLGDQNPAAVARRIERERGRGRPVRWESDGFEAMLRWRDARLVAGAVKPPRTLAELDAAGEAYVTIFNCLHDLDPRFRQTMLRGLGPVEVLNAVVGGELELYRMGTSSYRDYLHAGIMRGIKESGSVEAFLERAVPRWPGRPASHIVWQRGMVLLRVVSSFGLLDDVLAGVRDRGRFIDDTIAALGDAGAFEANGSVVLDVVTARSGSPASLAFRRELLERLYGRYQAEVDAKLRSIYGSLLSVYQTVTGDRREAAIDREFPLDDAMFRIPFQRLFSPDGKGGLVHRMFMRMDQDVDAAATYAGFRALMRSRGAMMRQQGHFDVYRIVARGRMVEIYTNKPTAVGIKEGIAGIAGALGGKRVETVIGRGHTSIVAPLQEDARRILGERIKDAVAVLVGTCGGDASMRDLIATFGYKSFFTTRSTGRQAINNAIMEAYIASLMSLAPGGQLALAEVLERATGRFMRKGSDEELRGDASFYRLSMASVLTAKLYATHVRPSAGAVLQVARQ
ncbi:MAG: hypothetical protein SFW09_07605 [Hyphomicrobiaceae bacterium]|nr:hypothetical protein [Hyphomicrobiaceae bacterium]